jgi:hypothetical protein
MRFRYRYAVIAMLAAAWAAVLPVAVADAEPATVPACATAQLAPSIGPPEGAAGTIFYPLILQNTSDAACSMSGYPEVSFIAGSDNHPVGAAATPDPEDPGTVVIDPGQASSANLGIVNSANFPADCNAVPVSGLQVSLSGQPDSLVVGHADTGCASAAYSTLRVGPFTGA